MKKVKESLYEKANVNEEYDTDGSNETQLGIELEHIFQLYASKGMPFEIVKEIVDTALNQIDWDGNDERDEDGETPEEIAYKRDVVYHGRSEIPPKYR